MHTAKSVAIGIVILTLAAAIASPDHLLLLCVGGVLAGGVWWLWPTTDAPLLLLPFGLQWAAVSIKPIQSALTGLPVDSLADFDEPLTAAAYLGIAGVAALGLGMRLAAGRARIDWARTLDRDARQWPAGIVIQIALFLIIVGHGLAIVAAHSGPARQILLALADVRHAGLFLLAYWCLLQGRALPLLAVVVVFEVVVGLTGFFADFRASLLVLLAAAAAARPRLSLRGFVGIGVAITATLVVSVFWSAIKPDYRGFLSQGAHEQVVARPMGQRLGYLGQAVDEFNGDQFQNGLRALVSRLSYIDFLASTLNHVPNVIPHENGARLGQALLNIVEPRVLFPDKPPTPDDTAVTGHYTGLRMTRDPSASISIGYLGELYIDFGYVGAVIGAFIIGLFGGLIYRVLRDYRGIPMLFSYSIMAMAMLPFALFETDLVRFLGSAVTVFAAALVLQRFAAPQVLLILARRDARAALDGV